MVDRVLRALVSECIGEERCGGSSARIRVKLEIDCRARLDFRWNGQEE